VFAGKSVGQVTSHYADVIRQLSRKPIIVGHSFGGLITEKLAGMGLAAASVAISPAPFRGVLPLPIAALRSALPVLGNPFNAKRAVTLTPAQFRFAFGNAVSEEEARNLYTAYHVPGAGLPIFQAAFANLNPWTEASVNTRAHDRGPLLIISGENDHTVPWAMANASYKLSRRSKSPTEITRIPSRGHSLTIDGGWQEVADAVLRFVERQRVAVPAPEPGAATGLVVEAAHATV
jgi:pimeloyl-ACP methyl ester carboxylesterase